MNIDITIRNATASEALKLVNFLNKGGEPITPVKEPVYTQSGDVLSTGVDTVVTSILPGEDGTPEPTFNEASTGIEVDSRGFPWDARIHAATKTKTQKGDWKKKRGVADEEVTRVEAELMGNVPASGVTQATPTVAPSAGQPATAPEQTAPQVAPNVDPVEVGMTAGLAITPEQAAASAAQQHVMPGTAQPAAPVNNTPSVDFGSLMATVMQRCANPADALTDGTVNAVLINCGVMGGIAALANHPDKMDLVAQQLAAVQ